MYESYQRSADYLRNKGIRNVLITLGSAGAVLCNDEGYFYSPAIEGIPVVDPTAAGDSFVGAFCIGVCCGWPWQRILDFANCVASLTVSAKSAMPSIPALATVESFINEHSFFLPNFSELKYQ